MTTYYHFAAIGEDGQPRLRFGDDRPVVKGETLSVEGELVMCNHGLHACALILDAIAFVEGDAALCRVELGGHILSDCEKACARSRKVVEMLSAPETTALLFDFAFWAARQSLRWWPDAPRVVHKWLRTREPHLAETVLDAALEALNAEGSEARREAVCAVHGTLRPWATEAAEAAGWSAIRATIEAGVDELGPTFAGWEALHVSARRRYDHQLHRMYRAALKKEGNHDA